MTDNFKKILIVCAGNSCRSPIAEALLKKAAKGYDLQIKSAGIIALDGMPPSTETINILKKNEQINLASFGSTRLTKELVLWADIILAMDNSQVEFINREMPDAKNKIFLMKQFAGADMKNPDIPDPMGKGEAAYAESYSQIKDCINKIILKLSKK